MSCKMREVEVVLIEDANKPQQTQALILSFNCDLDAKHVSRFSYPFADLRMPLFDSCAMSIICLPFYFLKMLRFH